jgi:hypothetical protein
MLNDTDIETSESSAISRRTLVKTAAGVGVAAAAVGIVGVANASQTSKAASFPSQESGTAASGPIVAHVTDLGSGTVELFSAGSRTQINDVDLAARIARAAH